MSFSDAFEYLTMEELFWISVFLGFNVVWLVLNATHTNPFVGLINVAIQLGLLHWAEELTIHAVKRRKAGR